MLISLDTECTGLDFVHGAKPFLVTTCDDTGEIRFWEWPVDPMTRQPEVPQDDLVAIAELLDAADLIYMQNSKFDTRALATIGLQLPWPKVRDTLAMGHLLASNHPHDLTSMCLEYLGANIEPLELHIKEVTRACRAIVKKDYPQWRIAKEGEENMPSVKGSSDRDEDKPWKNDMWLPRALAAKVDRVNTFRLKDNNIPNKNWLDACSRYANGDSEHTLPLGLEMELLIRQRGYWKVYEERCKLPRVACGMECYGVTAIGDYTRRTIGEYEQYVAEAEAELLSIAKDHNYDLELADGAAINDNMRGFFYGSIVQNCPVCSYVKRIKHWNGEEVSTEPCPKCIKRKKTFGRYQLVTKRSKNLNLRVINSKKTGNASLDKDAMQDYLTTLDGPALDFIRILMDRRKHATDLTYMEAYKRFGVPVAGADGYFRVHPSLNPFATDHLRWASNSPNMQNVGGQEEVCDECDGGGCSWCGGTGKTRMSVKRCFGPAPGREWYTADYKSIERRIPAYESGEPKMIEVFEKPNEPPFWGNLYNLTASVLYPDKYMPLSHTEGLFRKTYPRLYKQAKFFDLAKQYGCGRAKGDLLSKVRNSFDLIDSEFPMLAKLQAKYLTAAEKNGFVETIPDREVDPERGYPVLASRTDDGRVLSTTPFNYHISGTACQAKNKALVRCDVKLGVWRSEGFDGHIALEIHDEILFDFPRGATPDANKWRALELKAIMERSGDDIGMPTPVSVEYHPVTWAEGITIT